MERLVNDIMDSVMLYGAVAFVVFWLIFASALSGVAEWFVPYGVVAMASLPVFILLDIAMYFIRRLYK